MSNDKQSSVELFIEQLEEMGDLRDCESLGLIQLNIDKNDYLALKEQAKAMHKEERISDYYQGACDESDSHGAQSIIRADAERWYNETFGE